MIRCRSFSDAFRATPSPRRDCSVREVGLLDCARTCFRQEPCSGVPSCLSVMSCPHSCALYGRDFAGDDTRIPSVAVAGRCVVQDSTQYLCVCLFCQAALQARTLVVLNQIQAMHIAPVPSFSLAHPRGNARPNRRCHTLSRTTALTPACLTDRSRSPLTRLPPCELDVVGDFVNIRACDSQRRRVYTT